MVATSQQIKAADEALKRKAAAQKAATMQADADAKVKAKPPSMDIKPGGTPTLHQLNAQRLKADADIKNESHDKALAVARATKEILEGKGSGRPKASGRAGPAAAKPVGRNTAAMSTAAIRRGKPTNT